MPREVDVMGVFFPSLLVAFLGVVPLFLILDSLLARVGFYRWVWHIDVFRLCLFLLLFCSLGIFWYR